MNSILCCFVNTSTRYMLYLVDSINHPSDNQGQDFTLMLFFFVKFIIFSTLLIIYNTLHVHIRFLFNSVAEVSERFLKDVNKEQKTGVLRKCITSIATRCKTLRYNRSKSHVENHWTIHASQTGDVKQQIN